MALQPQNNDLRLAADEEVQLKVLPTPENPFEAMFGADLGAEREVQVFSPLRHLAPELVIPIRRAMQLRRVMRDPVILMMPYWIDIQ